MTLIFYVECPECHQSYYGDVELLNVDVELHCPYCGLYFKKEDSPNLVKPAKTTHDIRSTTGEDLGKYQIYKPKNPLRIKL